jgi:hypothetical protein
LLRSLLSCPASRATMTAGVRGSLSGLLRREEEEEAVVVAGEMAAVGVPCC